jgi:hypothetical protein
MKNFWLEKAVARKTAWASVHGELVQTPVLLDPDIFAPRKGLIPRYGPKILSEGAKFYARLSVKNFVV